MAWVTSEAASEMVCVKQKGRCQTRVELVSLGSQQHRGIRDIKKGSGHELGTILDDQCQSNTGVNCDQWANQSCHHINFLAWQWRPEIVIKPRSGYKRACNMDYCIESQDLAQPPRLQGLT
jgi:hypothetical protein